MPYSLAAAARVRIDSSGGHRRRRAQTAPLEHITPSATTYIKSFTTIGQHCYMYMDAATNGAPARPGRRNH
eukprot:scaffold437643_cov27-Prasinocladus_malaysianus.AAC.1